MTTQTKKEIKSKKDDAPISVEKDPEIEKTVGKILNNLPGSYAIGH